MAPAPPQLLQAGTLVAALVDAARASQPGMVGREPFTPSYALANHYADGGEIVGAHSGGWWVWLCILHRTPQHRWCIDAGRETPGGCALVHLFFGTCLAKHTT